MRALVVYESLWGNTEQVARAIAERLRETGTVDIVDTDSAPTVIDGYDLLIAGGPTHAFSMTRRATREDAVSQHDAPRRVERGLREWLDEVQRPTSRVPAVAFDTRVDRPRLPGSAAKAAKHELRSLGFDTSVTQRTFRVHGYEGPLLDGELDGARSWADDILRLLAETAPQK